MIETTNATGIPEPWQDIKLVEPTQAQADLLAVDDQSLAYRDTLMQVTSHLVGAALRTPYHSGYYEKVSKPQVGDLVMEYTTGWWSQSLRTRAWSFGVLAAARDEWWYTAEEWAAVVAAGEARGQPRPHGQTFYIRWGRQPEDIQRWVNSQVILVPMNRDDFGV